MATLLRRVPFGRSPRLAVGHYALDNGLTVLVVTDDAAPVVAYQTWIRVGSAFEDATKTGLAHLFEHLMFNETENLPPGVFDRKLEELGAQTNAATWLDWTYYHELLPAESLSVVVPLEAERLSRLLVQEKQVETEREVVANERRFRVEDDVGGAMEELLWKTAFTAHSYRWPTIGWMDHILGFTVADCQAFYRTYYAPNNATVIVVGDVPEAEAVDLVERHYGGMSRQDVPPPPSVVEPPQGGERVERITWPMSAARLVLGFHGVSLGHQDHAALTVLNEVLYGGRSGRLRALLLDDLELVSEVSGWVPPLRWPGLYEMHAALREGASAERVIEVIEREVERLADHGPTGEEMAKALARGERSYYEGHDSADGKAQDLGFYQTSLDDFSQLFERVTRLEAVSAADVARVAREYLSRDNRTLVLAEPEGEGA